MAYMTCSSTSANKTELPLINMPKIIRVLHTLLYTPCIHTSSYLFCQVRTVVVRLPSPRSDGRSRH